MCMLPVSKVTREAGDPSPRRQEDGVPPAPCALPKSACRFQFVAIRHLQGVSPYVPISVRENPQGNSPRSVTLRLGLHCGLALKLVHARRVGQIHIERMGACAI